MTSNTRLSLLGKIGLLAPVAAAIVVPLPRNRVLEAVMDLGHAPVFAIIAVLLLAVVGTGGLLGRSVSVMGLVAVLGVGIELIQGRVGRSVSKADVAADLLGAVAGLAWAGTRGSTTARRALLVVCGVAALGLASARPVCTLWDIYRQQRDMPVLASFEHSREMSRWTFRDSVGKRSHEHATLGEWALRLEMAPGEYPGAALAWPPADWTGRQELCFDTYLEPGPMLQLNVKVEDAAHNHQDEDRFLRTLNLQPGAEHHCIPLAAVERAPKGRRLDLGHVARVVFFAYELQVPHTLFLDGIVLTGGR